jgi:hypothetical protein
MRNQDSSSNASTIILLQITLDDVFSDHRFFVRKSMSPCQIARYVLSQILQGERSLGRLKTATLEKINADDDQQKLKGKPMKIVEAQHSFEAHSSGRDLRFMFGYFGLAICMLATIYAAASSPGNTLGDLAAIAVFP